MVRCPSISKIDSPISEPRHNSRRATGTTAPHPAAVFFPSRCVISCVPGYHLLAGELWPPYAHSNEPCPSAIPLMIGADHLSSLLASAFCRCLLLAYLCPPVSLP